MKAGVNCTSLAGGQAYLTPPKVITGATAYFKKKNIFTSVVTRALASVVKASSTMMVVTSSPSILIIEATTIGPST